MPTPANPSLAYKLETWAIDILGVHTLFPGVKAGSESVLAGDEDVLAGAGFAIVHQEEETRPTNSRIVCTAKIGDRESGGVRPWNVTLEVRLILIERSTDTVEDYVRAIEETFDEPPTVASLADFAYLTLLDEEEEEKDVRSDSRQRVKTYTFHALENREVAMAGDEVTLAGSTTTLAGSGEDE